MEFRVLGQVELWANGRRYELGPRKARCVLALLLCELGHPVPAETLVSRIWGDEPSDGALKSLYESVSRLRKSLRAAGGSGRELAQQSGSYVLDVSRQNVDAWRFRMFRDQARAASAHGDDERAVDLLHAAEALWRGTPLDGMDGDWAEGVRVRLNEERFAASLQRIKAGLQLGRYADLVSEIADLTRRHPLDEALLDLHLRALYGSGRKAEALAAYRQAERRWREGYGGDLGSALRNLQQLMLHDDPTLSAAPSAWVPSRPAAGGSAARPEPSSTMPRDNPDFTGRAAELRTLTSWLDSDKARSSVPVVVIGGMAGVGKTALAVHAAHQLRGRYPEQVFVRLRAHDASEAPLNPGTALFSRTAGPGTRTAADGASIARLVRMCGHLPLRVQLAGRQLQVHSAWSVSDLVARFSDAGSGAPDMTAQLDLSYRYLTASQQRIFRWLALQPTGSFSSHAVATIAGGESPSETEHALEVLLDYHLIEEPVPGRYEFHAVLREYAEGLAKDVDSEDDRRSALGRLLGYYLGLLDHADRVAHPFGRRMALLGAAVPPVPSPRPLTRRECIELLDTEKANLLATARYAGDHGWPSHAAMFAYLLGAFLDTWGDWTDAIELHRRAASAWRAAGNAPGEASALIDLGLALCRTGYQAEAAGHLQEALAIARTAADTAREAAALNTIGIIKVWSDSYEESLASHDQALALWRQLGDRHGEADALSHGVLPAERLGRHRDALSRAELALAAYRELGDPHGETKVLNNLGGLQQDAGCYDDALLSYEQAMTRFTEIGDRQGEAIALSNIGDIRRLSGRHHEALRDYRAALGIFSEIGDRGSSVETINGMAAAFAGTGDWQEALDQYEKALALATGLAERHAQATSHLGIGAVHLAIGHYRSAADDFRAALKLSQDIADPVHEGHALLGLGRAVLHTEGSATAHAQWRAALALFDATGRPEADEVRALLSAPPAGT